MNTVMTTTTTGNRSAVFANEKLSRARARLSFLKSNLSNPEQEVSLFRYCAAFQI